MAVATLVNTCGNALFLTAAVLFYTRMLHLTPHLVGTGLTVAGLVALLVGVPAGHLADLRGAREVLIVLCVGLAAVMCVLPFVHGYRQFLTALVVYGVLDRASNAVRQGLIASVFVAEERVRGRAYLRAVTNLGIAGGSAVAGAAIALDSRAAYEVLIVGDAVTYLLAAVAISALPVSSRRERSGSEGMLTALRDRPFVVVTVLSGLMALQYSLMEVGLPLWVDRYTEAPRWMIAVLYLVNTVACVLFQVRAAKAATDVTSSARLNLRGALFVAASCLVFALSQGRAEPVAVALLVLGAAVHVTGELFQAAGSWGLGFGLSPEHAQGQYQGLYTTGFAAAMVLGPLFITSTVIAWGRPGWYLLAGVFVVTGLAVVPVARWAEGTRQPAVLQA